MTAVTTIRVGIYTFTMFLSAASRRLSRPCTRSFAELVPIQSAQPNTPPSASAEVSPRRRKRRSQLPLGSVDKAKPVRVPVREDHGLYGFFRRKPGDNLTGEDRYEVVETPDDARMISGICDLSCHSRCLSFVFQGRAWEASELRLKSFKDLHTLWYVAAREQNLLATQKEEVRRMGASAEFQVPIEKVRNVG